MREWVLKNGLRLVFVPKKSDSVTVHVLVDVGSNYETPHTAGISHFIEHMVFEGTEKRVNAREIAQEIERLGGEFNAYTTAERTCFYAKVVKRHFDTALDVISDILQRPLFRPEDVQRQRHIIFKEIDLVNDDPRAYQWILFQKTLFTRHPSRNPTYGTKKAVLNASASNIKHYFSRYYVPGSMILVVVGDVDGVREKCQGAFNMKNRRTAHRTFSEPLQTKIRIKKEKKVVANSYVVVGHQTVPRAHPDSYVLEVIDGILGRGQSGWMFDDIRNRAGLAYEVGTQHVSEKDYGFFATYASVDKKNIPLVQKLILAQLERLKNVDGKDVRDAQTYLEGDFVLEHEDTQKIADGVAFWAQMGRAASYFEYIKQINKVTVNDVQRVAEKYFSQVYTAVVVEGKG